MLADAARAALFPPSRSDLTRLPCSGETGLLRLAAPTSRLAASTKRSAAARGNVTREEIENRIFDIVRQDILSVDDAFTKESNLIEAGLDSLALTQLMLAIEESTGVWVDESLLTEETLSNVRTLSALVHQALE
jgi:acyl carrier protein